MGGGNSDISTYRLDSAILSKNYNCDNIDIANDFSKSYKDSLHISALNPYFCELTSLFWAWKHLKADYYGLFHYRRILDFSPQSNAKNQVCFYNRKKILPKISEQYILQTCKDYDIIAPTLWQDEKHSMYSQYEMCHHIKDLDACVAYIKATNPKMHEVALKSLHKCPASWHTCNMFVMKDWLFFEYCEWLFDVLFNANICYKSYDSYQQRVFGFLAERLFNVWLDYKKHLNPHIKIKELPSVFLRFEPQNRLVRCCYKALKKVL